MGAGCSVWGVPHEISIGGVYFAPLLLASLLGVLATAATVMLLNRYRLSRFFIYPPLMFIAIAILYTGLIGALWLHF